MSGEMMRGARTVRDAYASYLATAMPDLLAHAREVWDLEEYLLPDILEFNSRDPLVTNVYPTTGCYVSRGSNFRQNDSNDAGEQVYSTKYDVTAFIWVKTPLDETQVIPEHARSATMDVRDDMVSCLENCLLVAPTWGSNGIVRMDEGTLNVEYFDPVAMSKQAGMWMAGASLSFTVWCSEQTYVPTLGTAETFQVTERLVGTTQPME